MIYSVLADLGDNGVMWGMQSKLLARLQIAARMISKVIAEGTIISTVTDPTKPTIYNFQALSQINQRNSSNVSSKVNSSKWQTQSPEL